MPRLCGKQIYHFLANRQFEHPSSGNVDLSYMQMTKKCENKFMPYGELHIPNTAKPIIINLKLFVDLSSGLFGDSNYKIWVGSDCEQIHYKLV